MQRVLLSSLCAAVCAVTCVDPAYAFRWEAHTAVGEVEIGSNIDASSGRVGGTYYFSDVESELPPIHAAFASRASAIAFVASTEERRHRTTRAFTTSSTLTREDIQTDGGFAISGRKVWKTTGWFLDASYDAADTDYAGTLRIGRDADLYGRAVGIGKYLGAATALRAGLRSAESTLAYAPSSLCGVVLECVTEATQDFDGAALSGLHVGVLGALGYSIGGRVEQIDTRYRFRTTPIVVPRPPAPSFPILAGAVVIETSPLDPAATLLSGDYEVYGLTGEIFPSPSLGIRIGYTRWSDDLQRDHAFDVGLHKFFRERYAVLVTFSQTTYVSLFRTSRRSEELALEIRARF
jgi:hypothetical protein